MKQLVFLFTKKIIIIYQFKKVISERKCLPSFLRPLLRFQCISPKTVDLKLYLSIQVLVVIAGKTLGTESGLDETISVFTVKTGRPEMTILFYHRI